MLQLKHDRIRLGEAEQRLSGELVLAIERLQETEQSGKVRSDKVFEKNVCYRICEVVARWAFNVPSPSQD